MSVYHLTENCTTDGAVRLIGGQDNLQGTIQICIGGVWGSVCDDLWGTMDANVICNQLGHSPYSKCFQWMQLVRVQVVSACC